MSTQLRQIKFEGMGVLPPKPQPQFSHDCDDCELFLKDEEFDFYVHKRENLTEFVGRYSSEGPDYASLSFRKGCQIVLHSYSTPLSRAIEYYTARFSYIA